MRRRRTPWIHYWSRPIVAGVVATMAVLATSLAVGVFGTGINSNAQADSHVPSVVTSKPVSTSDVQNHKTESLQALEATVYRSPTCGCCGAWMHHLKTQAFQVTDVPTDNMEAIKQENHVPDNLTSCHTAVIDGYVIEGHVPANDIKRLLKERPNVVGLSVLGMPLGSPGMEAGSQRESYAVFSFNRDGSSQVFSDYPSS